MADVVCTDNRFELIAKYKAKLVEATNIETDKAEMDVIDNVLFRIWQMGWLDTLEQVVRCKDCVHRIPPTDYCEKLLKSYVPDDFFCFYGERKEKEDGTAKQQN